MDKLSLGAVTLCMSKATLAAGTTTTFNTTGATLYSIRGKVYTTSAAANSATPTTDGNTGAAFVPVTASKGSVFVFAYDGSSTTAATAIKVYQGTVEPMTTDASGANAKFIGPGPTFPAVPTGVCPFGYVVTKVGASGTAWTFGSSNLAGPPSNVLHTFQDINSLPDRPQVA